MKKKSVLINNTIFCGLLLSTFTTHTMQSNSENGWWQYISIGFGCGALVTALGSFWWHKRKMNAIQTQLATRTQERNEARQNLATTQQNLTAVQINFEGAQQDLITKNADLEKVKKKYESCNAKYKKLFAVYRGQNNRGNKHTSPYRRGAPGLAKGLTAKWDDYLKAQSARDSRNQSFPMTKPLIEDDEKETPKRNLQVRTSPPGSAGSDDSQGSVVMLSSPNHPKQSPDSAHSTGSSPGHGQPHVVFAQATTIIPVPATSSTSSSPEGDAK